MAFCTVLQREWIAVPPQGEEQRFLVRVSLPLARATGEWTSQVALGSITHGCNDIHGLESWQAVELALRHAAVSMSSTGTRSGGHGRDAAWECCDVLL
jgi:hypothetical protein